MTIVKWIAAIALIYAGIAAFMYAAQRKLMYFPETQRTPPSAAGLPQAEEIVLETSDGEKVIAWHVPPAQGRSVVLYFQGNGGSLRLRARRFGRLTSDGSGLVALSYRGYGGSTGAPSEAGLLRDAAAAYEFAAARYGGERVVAWGESLGTGIAVTLAAEQKVAGVILESPYSSIADVAASVYWFLPVRWLIKDTFHSDMRAGAITAPVLVMHGERDRVIPIAFAEKLYEVIRAPKRFVRLAHAEHNDHDEHGATEVVRDFLKGAN